jgi:hypothetical protein
MLRFGNAGPTQTSISGRALAGAQALIPGQWTMFLPAPGTVIADFALEAACTWQSIDPQAADK